MATHVGEAIAQQAEATNADLILVGNTGHSMLGELILGSTSKYVLRHAPCSVWISRRHPYPSDHPLTPADIAKTVNYAAGIDELQAEDPQGRPYNLLEEGEPIKALFG